MRRSIPMAVIALLALLVTGCSGSGAKVPTFASTGKLKVAASFYPLYEFASTVGGDKVEVVNLVPPGTEPHDWEPTAGHVKTLNSAKVFLYNGAGFEHWVTKTLKSLDNKQVLAVETSKGFALLEAHEEDDGHGEEEAGGGFDPHIWIDPLGAVHTVQAIKEAFIQADGANKATYEANAAALVAKLTALDGEFKSGLARCKTNKFFTSHDAFGYVAQRYGLEQHAIMGLAPDAEPTPKDLQKIVEEARQDNIKYIFFETLVSDKVAKVVASEIKAQTLVLNPFEGLTADEIKAGKSYVTVMKDNLANLKTALECGK